MGVPQKERNRIVPGLCSCGCGSKIGTPNGTLVSGNLNQNLRNPSCLILSHTQIGFRNHPQRSDSAIEKQPSASIKSCTAPVRRFACAVNTANIGKASGERPVLSTGPSWKPKNNFLGRSERSFWDTCGNYQCLCHV